MPTLLETALTNLKNAGKLAYIPHSEHATIIEKKYLVYKRNNESLVYIYKEGVIQGLHGKNDSIEDLIHITGIDEKIKQALTYSASGNFEYLIPLAYHGKLGRMHSTYYVLLQIQIKKNEFNFHIVSPDEQSTINQSDKFSDLKVIFNHIKKYAFGEHPSNEQNNQSNFECYALQHNTLENLNLNVFSATWLQVYAAHLAKGDTVINLRDKTLNDFRVEDLFKLSKESSGIKLDKKVNKDSISKPESTHQKINGKQISPQDELWRSQWTISTPDAKEKNSHPTSTVTSTSIRSSTDKSPDSEKHADTKINDVIKGSKTESSVTVANRSTTTRAVPTSYSTGNSTQTTLKAMITETLNKSSKHANLLNNKISDLQNIDSDKKRLWEHKRDALQHVVSKLNKDDVSISEVKQAVEDAEKTFKLCRQGNFTGGLFKSRTSKALDELKNAANDYEKSLKK